MAKVVWKTTPRAAYEWAEVEGGDTMSDAQRDAFLDEFVSDNGLVPVETTYAGEVPTHKYGRYKAGFTSAAALAPLGNPGQQGDLTKANAEIDRLKAELARATDQLDKKPEKSKAEVVDDVVSGIGSASISTTEDAREALNQQEGVNLVGGSEEMRVDMSTADRSDNNPKVDADGKAEVRRGRPRKDA